MARLIWGIGISVLLVALGGVALWAGPAGADGTETLGPPTIAIATGDDFVGKGVGLFGTEPTGPDPGGSRPVSLTVPAGATVQQVLVYWEGQSFTAHGATDTILVNGTTVTGSLIGGPTNFGPGFTQTYRADVTALGLLAPGANTVNLGGLNFDRKNSGAAVFAILESADRNATVAMRDGNDFAFNERPAPLDTTVPLSITFPTVTADTVAHPLLFVSSVDNERPRSSIVRLTFDTGDVVDFGNVLMNTDGDEWDTFQGPVTVPAGASSATVQILSAQPGGVGPQPASLVWNLAAISIPTQAGGGLQVLKTISGATAGYAPETTFTVAVDCDGTAFDTTFELTPGGAGGAIGGLPIGTSCTVTETGVPDPLPGFAYGTPTYSPAQTVQITGESTVTVTVDNPLAELGTLQVRKTISGATAGHDPDTTFTVAVDCDGTEFDTTFELTPGGAAQTVGPLPDGTTCTVTETGVPDPLPGFSYAPPTYSPAQTVTVPVTGTVTVTVDNPLEEPGLALTASALCLNDTPYVDYEAVLDGIDAPNGVTVRWTNTSTGAVQQELTNQPLAGRLLWPGAAVDPGGEPIDWPGWEFVDGEWVEVDDGLRPEIDLTVEVNPEDTVRLDYPPPLPDCNPNPNGGLQVVKAVIGARDGYVPGSQFQFTMSCTDPTFDDAFVLADGGTFVKEHITLGTTCTVTETTTPDPVSGFAWVEAIYRPAQSVTVADEATLVQVQVENGLISRRDIPNTGASSLNLGLVGMMLATLGGVFMVSAKIVRRRG